MKLVEKYRPKTFDEVEGQEHIIPRIRDLIKKEYIPPLLFLGPPGSGKTSVAICIAREKFGKKWRSYYIEFNASDDRGIDMVRGRIKTLLSTKGRRVVLLDEMDNMTKDAQQALRRPMEKTVGTILILSGNYGWKVLKPIQSRCAIFYFKRLTDKQVAHRLLGICKKENIQITPEHREGFLQLIKDSKGDLRYALNTLEKVVNAKKELTIQSLIELQKTKMASDALTFALSGNFERAKNLLEDAYISANFNVEEIIDDFYEAIGNIEENDNPVKIRLYAKLAETERNCKLNTNPLVQLVGFMSWVWIAPHLDKSLTKGC